MPTFLVLCRNCKNKMKYQSKTNILAGKSKQCVYCGKAIKVSNSVLKTTEN